MATRTLHSTMTPYDAGRAPAARLGSTGTVTNTGSIKQDIDQNSLLSLSDYIQFVLLADMNKEAAKDIQVIWNEEALRAPETYIQWESGTKTLSKSSAITATFEASQIKAVQVNQTFAMYGTSITDGNRTVIVTAVDRTAGTVTMKLFGGSDYDALSYTLAAGRYKLVWLGSAWADGTGYPDGHTFTGDQKWNATQIFKDTKSRTGVYQSLEQYIKSQYYMEQVAKMTKMQLLDLQSAMLFSDSAFIGDEDDARKMAGMNAYLTTNRFHVPGALSESIVESVLDVAFNRQDSVGTKFCLCPPNFPQVLRNIYRERLVMNDQFVKELNMNIKVWNTPRGKLNLVVTDWYSNYNWVLHSDQAGDKRYDGKWALIFDQKHLKSVMMKGRDFAVEPNVQLPGYDKKIDLLLGERSMKYTLEETGLILSYRDGGFNDVSDYYVGDGLDLDTDPYTFA